MLIIIILSEKKQILLIKRRRNKEIGRVEHKTQDATTAARLGQDVPISCYGNY